MRNHFRFSHGAVQKLSATFFAFLIPSLFVLTLSLTKPFTGTKKVIMQSQLVFTQASRSITAPLNTATIIRKKSLFSPSKKSTEKPKSTSLNIELAVPLITETNPPLNSPLTLDMTVTRNKNHSSNLDFETVEQKTKSKAAWAAYQDSRSEIQKMASRKGIALHSTRLSKYDEFQHATENAVIPDCLEKGASSKLGLDSLKGLLVIPALAVSALRGKCK